MDSNSFLNKKITVNANKSGTKNSEVVGGSDNNEIKINISSTSVAQDNKNNKINNIINNEIKESEKNDDFIIIEKTENDMHKLDATSIDDNFSLGGNIESDGDDNFIINTNKNKNKNEINLNAGNGLINNSFEDQSIIDEKEIVENNDYVLDKKLVDTIEKEEANLINKNKEADFNSFDGAAYDEESAVKTGVGNGLKELSRAYNEDQLARANAAVEIIKNRVLEKKATDTKDISKLGKLDNLVFSGHALPGRKFSGLESRRILRSGNAKETNEEKRERLSKYKIAKAKEIEKYGKIGYLARYSHTMFYDKKQMLFDEKYSRIGGKDSSEMKIFKKWVKELSLTWEESFSENMTASFYDEKRLVILKCFDEAIAAGSNYIEKKNPHTMLGKQRLLNVMDMVKNLEQERAKFQLATEQYKDLSAQERKHKEYHTWADLLFDIRAEHIENNFQATEHGSTESTKKVTIDGRQYFFKPAEYVESKNLRSPSELIKEYGEFMSKDYKSAIKNMVSVVKALQLKDVNSDVKQMAQNMVKHIDALYKSSKPLLAAQQIVNLYTQISHSPRYSVINSISGLKEVADLSRILVQRETQRPLDAHEKALKEDYLKHHAIYAPKAHSFSLADGNGIPAGANLSNRSVATTRVADAFNMGELVVRSKNCVLKLDDDNYSTGVLMEKAEGMTYSDLKDAVNRKRIEEDNVDIKIYWSEKANKHYIQLMLLDFICGQCDRHTNNFMVQHEVLRDGSVLITDIKGIDNDLSFGNLCADDCKSGFNRMLPIFNIQKQRINLRHIDEDTFIKITTMDDVKLKLAIVDLGFSDSEIENLMDRLSFVQAELKHEADNNPDFVIKNYKNKKMSGLVYNKRADETSSIKSIWDNNVLYDDQIVVGSDNVKDIKGKEIDPNNIIIEKSLDNSQDNNIVKNSIIIDENKKDDEPFEENEMFNKLMAGDWGVSTDEFNADLMADDKRYKEYEEYVEKKKRQQKRNKK